MAVSGTTGAPGARIGRPKAAQLTEAKLKRILKLVEEGVPQGAAAGSVGVPTRTWQAWLERGRAENAVEPYRTLAERLQLSLDKFHASRVKQLHKVGSDDPKVIQWELERRFRAEWADPARGDVNVHVNVSQSAEFREVMGRIASFLRENHPEAFRALAAELGYHDPSERAAIEAA